MINQCGAKMKKEDKEIKNINKGDFIILLEVQCVALSGQDQDNQ